MRNLIRTILLCTVLLGVCTGLDARKKYVIIVSLDGFRWDYPEIHGAPNLDAMAFNGVSATMMPSFPASTFPNHYALATGLVPDHNGIVNNSFWAPDQNDYYSMGGPNRSKGEYFLGEPIWLTAQRQGVHTGVVYWVGSDVAIQGKYPDSYKMYQEPLIPYEDRIDTVMAFFEKPKKERPRLIMLYFDEPDHTGHGYGPTSKECGVQVHRVDRMIGLLRQRIAASKFRRDIDLIVLADHGMTDISPLRIVNPSKYVKPEWYDHMLTGTPTSIFTKPEFRDSVYLSFKKAPHVSVWKKEEIPAGLNYGSSERVGDIVVAPDLGWQIADKPRTSLGAHGYSPFDDDMKAVFRAEGPDFKKGYKAASFRNVTIYPLLCRLLGIKPAPNDGDIEEVKGMLRR